MPDDAFTTGSYLSPDNQRKAVVFIQAGGGGISPYCSQSISVIASEMEDKLAWGSDYTVFTSSCGSVGSDENIDGVKWVSVKQLSITFDVNVGISGISALMLKNHADEGQVRVIYVPRRSSMPEQ